MVAFAESLCRRNLSLFATAGTIPLIERHGRCIRPPSKHLLCPPIGWAVDSILRILFAKVASAEQYNAPNRQAGRQEGERGREKVAGAYQVLTQARRGLPQRGIGLATIE